jgi:serine/threonine-protein kinase
MVKTRQRLGKYRIEARLAEGPFANVFRAMDTIEGVRVALKIPHDHLTDRDFMEDFRSEVRLAAKLDHPNILSVKDASVIDSRFVIAMPLGEKTLHDRLQSRMSLRTALDYAEQMLEAVACAHANRVIHCDIKPENLILFPGNRMRLTDFGIAKVAKRTLQASGSGTVGYVAPEQAMGKPSFRSDVFSMGLILYRMLSGRLPEWPYQWPPPGFEKLRGRIHPDLIKLVRRAMDTNPRRRFKDAVQMLAALHRVKPRALGYSSRRRKTSRGKTKAQDWQTVRHRQFQKQHGKAMETRFSCSRCKGPVSEYMRTCPWCGVPRKTHRDETRFPVRCRRCNRGLKLDWAFCPWCFGPGFEVSTGREYPDKRYEARCSNPDCSRKLLMPYMRYCPWCRRKVRRKWKVPGSGHKCPSCGWGVFRSFWDHCPWCARSLRRR